MYKSNKEKWLKKKFVSLCLKLGITVITQQENFAFENDGSYFISLFSLKSRYDLNVAFHELAHIILNHESNSLAS